MYAYLKKRLEKKGHCVIILAEGMGDSIQDANLDTDLGTDKSGNVKMADVGLYLKKEIPAYFKTKGTEVTLKYIDPTYMIRTVPANPDDVDMCAMLAHNLCHGLMAGFTGFTVGLINNKTCLIPLKKITTIPISIVNRKDKKYQRMLGCTGQPSFLNKGDKYADKLIVNKLLSVPKYKEEHTFFKSLSIDENMLKGQSSPKKPLRTNLEIIPGCKDKKNKHNSYEKYIPLVGALAIAIPLITYWTLTKKKD